MQKNNNTIESILSVLNIEALNEMQETAVREIPSNDTTILLSATGSGKTLAFLLPVVFALDKSEIKTQVMIVVPTRELALQIDGVLRSMGTGFKVSCCYGGHKREIEENNLIQPPAILIGTPGRLGDHIRRGNITTASIHTLVLDEFDKSLELGFTEELEFILNSLTGLKKRILTSATRAETLPGFLGVQDPLELDFLGDGAPSEKALALQVVKSAEKEKIESLVRLISLHGNRSTIIFCNHREAVERTSSLLADKGIINTYYHGAMEQRDREVALAKFRNGSVNFLVTTDLASRGLDIPNIRYIIHYHLPATKEVFTHRNGRTARMDASGTAILILNEEEKLPDWIDETVEEITLPTDPVLPDKPKWTTIFVGAGKKDKVNKVDIVGFLSKKGELKKEDIGLIEVKDFFSFVALRKSKVSYTLQQIKDQKIKGKKVKIDVAK